MRNEKLILKLNNEGKYYWPTKGKDDEYLMILWMMLGEGKSFLHTIKNATLLPTTHGHFAANASAVIFTRNNNIVFVQPSYGDDAGDYRFELTRDALLKVINDWQALIVQEPDEIIMTRDELGVITLEGVFKEE